MISERTNQFTHLRFACLNVSNEMVRNLQMRATGLNRLDNDEIVTASIKCCPTRHGCTGATNCDCSYGDYHISN